MIRDGVFGNVEYFKDLVDSVNDIPNSGNDWFLVRHSQLRLMLAAKSLRHLLLQTRLHADTCQTSQQLVPCR